MDSTEMWQLVHACYGEELGLTSDDEDYVPPPLAANEVDKLPSRLSIEFLSEVFKCYILIILLNLFIYIHLIYIYILECSVIK